MKRKQPSNAQLVKLIGFVLVIFGLLLMASGVEPGQTRQQKNLEVLCAKPNVVCLDTGGGGMRFNAPDHIMDQICNKEVTGVTCPDRVAASQSLATPTPFSTATPFATWADYMTWKAKQRGSD